MLDHIHDTNCKHLVQVHREVTVPSFVKEADFSTEEDVKGLGKNCFADSTHRMYPIHTKADTWLSMAYFHKFGYALTGRQVVNDMLDKAATFWNIPDADIVRIKEAKEIEAKKPKFVVDYIYDTEKIASAAVETAEDLQKVASDLISNGTKYPFETRKAVSRQILKHAEAMDANFDRDTLINLQKTAGYGTTSKESLKDTLIQRAAIYKSVNADIASYVDKMASDVLAEDDGFVKPALLEKVAATIDLCDSFLDLTRHYRKSFNRPEFQLYTLTHKEASEFNDNCVELSNGTRVIKSRMHKAQEPLKQFFAGVFNQKIASEEELEKAVTSVTRSNELTAMMSIIDNA